MEVTGPPLESVTCRTAYFTTTGIDSRIACVLLGFVTVASSETVTACGPGVDVTMPMTLEFRIESPSGR